ncbi:hypothetical protein OAA62_00825 [bacterium]|nr:hypothetical protein [bacterium]
MSIAKEVNNRLDHILEIKSEINRMRADLANKSLDVELVNNETGEKVNASKIEELANKEIIQIKNELNKLTNNGKSITGIYNNEYYVNDMLQDKLIVQNNKLN